MVRNSLPVETRYRGKEALAGKLVARSAAHAATSTKGCAVSLPEVWLQECAKAVC
jgi:hypothetical protein